jgi:hypothetical protein
MSLPMRTYAAQVRLYFNHVGERPWSVDFGKGTMEMCVAEVDISLVSGKMVYEPISGDDKDTPTAWFEIAGATVTVLNNKVTITGEGNEKGSRLT